MVVIRDDDLLKQLKRILDRYGISISAAAYDKIDDPDKPSRPTLQRRFGSWLEAKALADSNVTDTKYIYLVKQNERLAQRLQSQKNVTQLIIDNCLAEISKCNFRPAKIPKPVKAKENLEFHAMRSDAQVGELTSPEWVQGVAHYDVNTYRKRLNKWTEKVLAFHEQDHKNLGLNKLVIYHLGDQVEGEGIYKGQPFALDLDLVKQVFISVTEETNAILTLAQAFSKVEVFTVIGNHGRPGRLGDHHPRTNFDYIFYRMLQMSLSNQKNVSVYVSESPSMLVKNGDFTFLLNHGDNAKSWAGIPYYGIDRQFKKLAELYGLVVDFELIGHHHTPANLGGKIYMNGCLPGGSDLSVNKLTVATRPSQKIFYFHPKNGINRETDLHLAQPIKLKHDDKGIYTAYS